MSKTDSNLTIMSDNMKMYTLDMNKINSAITMLFHYPCLSDAQL